MTGRDKKQEAESRRQKAGNAMLAGVLFFLCAPAAQAASLIAVSPSAALEEGKTVPVEWYLDTEGEVVNAVDLTLVFSKDTVELTAKPGRSLVSLWVQEPTVHEKEGVMTLVGGIPGGLSGTVPLFRTQITGRAEGPVAFALSSGSRVYRHDGKGTPVPLTLSQFQLSVVKAQESFISSKTHPDPDAWYRANDVELAFPYDPAHTYRYTFARDFNDFPSPTSPEAHGALAYPDLEDGVYYLRLLEDTKDRGAFRVQIDRTSPEAFTPLIATSTDVFSGAPFLSFATVDKTSGIDHFEVRAGWFGRSPEARSPFKITRPFIGDVIRVRAYDQAGNYQDARLVYPARISWKTLITMLTLLGAGMFLRVRYSRRKRGV